MEVKSWLKKNDIHSLLISDYQKYLQSFKTNYNSEYKKIFKDKDLDSIVCRVNGIKLICDYWYIDEYDFISARLNLFYNGILFAAFEAVYNVDGYIEDGYFRSLES
jgi:hypothetical protein